MLPSVRFEVWVAAIRELRLEPSRICHITDIPDTIHAVVMKGTKGTDRAASP